MSNMSYCRFRNTLNDLRDCMAAMAEMPDKAYELAIVDPPYGIGIGSGLNLRRGNS